MIEIANDVVTQMDQGQIDYKDLALNASKLSQPLSLIIVFFLPLIITIFFAFASCIFCCTLCCNASKKYHKKRFESEKTIIRRIHRLDKTIDISKTILQQVEDNIELKKDSTIRDEYNKLKDLEQSKEQIKTFKCMKCQFGYYVCYLITLAVTLCCYISIVCIIGLGIDFKYEFNAVDQMASVPKDLFQNWMPAEKSIDRFIGKYYMEDENFQFIEKTFNAKYTPQEFGNQLSQLLNKVNNITTLDPILDNLNNLFSEDQNFQNTLIYALRQIIYYKKCQEDYILQHLDQPNNCLEDEQTIAYKSGYKILDSVYDSSTMVNNILDYCDSIITALNDLPPKIINQTQIQDIQNQKDQIPDISQIDFNGIQVQKLIDVHQNVITLEQLVNEIVETQLGSQQPLINKLLNSDEQPPTISDLVGMDVTSTAKLIEQFITIDKDWTDIINVAEQIYEFYQFFMDISVDKLKKEFIDKDPCADKNSVTYKLLTIQDTIQELFPQMNNGTDDTNTTEDEKIDICFEFNNFMTNYKQSAIEPVVQYKGLLFAILFGMFILMPTLSCIAGEIYRRKCCYGCIACCMPAQAVCYFFIFAMFYMIGFINSGIFKPVIDTFTTNLDDTLNVAVDAVFSDKYVFYEKYLKEYLPDKQYVVSVPPEISNMQYLKILDQDNIPIQQVTLDFSGGTVDSILQSINYKLDIQQNSPFPIDSADNMLFDEFPYSMVKSLFKNLKSSFDAINTAIDQVSKDAIIPLNLKGTKFNFFKDSNEFMANSIKLNEKTIGQVINELMKTVVDNIFTDSAILTKLLEVNDETTMNPQQLTQDILNYVGINDTIITDALNDVKQSLDICSISDVLYQAQEQLKYISYPEQGAQVEIFNIFGLISQYVNDISQKTTLQDKKDVPLPSINIPSSVQDFQLSQLETLFMNFILFNEAQQGNIINNIINGDNTDNYLTGMYHNQQSDFKQFIDQYLQGPQSDSVDNIIQQVKSTDFQTYSNQIGCPFNNITELQDDQLVIYLANYINEINGSQSKKQTVLDIAQSMYNKGADNDLKEDDVFAMFGFCQVVQKLNELLLEQEYFETGVQSFNGNVKYVADLYPIADTIRQQVNNLNQTIINVYTYLIGEQQQCTTSGNEFIVPQNTSSFLNTAYDNIIEVIAGCLNGVRQGFYPNNTIKTSLLSNIKQSQITDMIGDLLSDIVDNFLQMSLGNSSFMSQKTMKQLMDMPLDTMDEVFYPFEALGVLFYILIIITFLLPWLLCLSKKYTYKRYYEGKYEYYLLYSRVKLIQSKKEEPSKTNKNKKEVIEFNQQQTAVLQETQLQLANETPNILQQSMQDQQFNSSVYF